jgi:hypothetical protein
MRKTFATLALASMAAISMTSCTAGPHQLGRSVDDWDQKSYVASPRINGVLHFFPIMALAQFIAGAGDFFVTDAYTFWMHDVWDDKGTAFEHHAVTATDGSMKSLLNEGSGWLKVDKK